MTVMLSSQGIGLITVMAVSGCSVMLLVLGRQKFLELKKDSAGNHKEGGLGSLCSESLNSFSVVEHCISSTKNWSSISWKINWDLSEALGSVRCCETAPSSPSKDLSLSVCSERSLSLPSAQLVKGQRSQDNKRRNSVKKVRFSDDVVEPSGDNAEYRRRHALASASRSGHVRSQKPQNGENVNVSSKRVDPLTHNSEGSGRKRSPVNNQECRMQTLAKPHIPPNRMALYNGIVHDRSQRALLY